MQGISNVRDGAEIEAPRLVVNCCLDSEGLTERICVLQWGQGIGFGCWIRVFSVEVHSEAVWSIRGGWGAEILEVDCEALQAFFRFVDRTLPCPVVGGAAMSTCVALEVTVWRFKSIGFCGLDLKDLCKFGSIHHYDNGVNGLGVSHLGRSMERWWLLVEFVKWATMINENNFRVGIVFLDA